MSIQDKAQADLVEPNHKWDPVELPTPASDAKLPLVSVIIRSMGRETLGAVSYTHLTLPTKRIV